MMAVSTSAEIESMIRFRNKSFRSRFMPLRERIKGVKTLTHWIEKSLIGAQTYEGALKTYLMINFELLEILTKMMGSSAAAEIFNQ